ncbi:MAG: potassium-transporting ATPase subunit KdpA [candidate division WOR-3 bacterium]|nr:potassium-transporting ATPase subunit KdpA [candidate division WOR-3 bacterium]
MTMSSALSLGFWLLALIGLAVPLGRYMARVFLGERVFLTGILRPFERFVYRACGVDETREMTAREYGSSVVVFTLAGLVLLFLLQALQRLLPLNPEGLAGVHWHTAINTAISFVTNTNWQSYGGEYTMSYLSQMFGLAVQNFVSAGVGIAALLAMVRGFTRKEAGSVGNFWVDLVRPVLYVLLPLSLLLALILVSQGVVQTLKPSATVRTLEGASQTIAVGPAASQIAIKQLGSNGGGYFNANSAHPFENPNWISNFLELLAILLIPVAMVFTLGQMLGNPKQGRALFYAMAVLFLLGLGVVLASELAGNPALRALGVEHGSNLAGKETRFGITSSVLWGQVTTVTSNGSVNSMHDAMTPLTGLVYMFNMGIGEAIFGGLGVGLMTMLFYVILTMFIAGLMIGRTPEFLGKKLGPFEMVMAVIGVLLPPVVLLTGAAVAVLLPTGRASLANPSAHGLSEILYAYLSAAGNNGSAFAGLNADTPFYNLTLGFTMLVGRFATILPGLAIAGALARKKRVPLSIATFPTTGVLFVVMLVAVIIVVGALTYFPVFALGPILEHLMLSGTGPL